MTESDSATGRADIVPLGDTALLVRFGTILDDAVNRATLTFARQLEADKLQGVLEVVPSLVSVLVRYDANAVSFYRLSGELALRLGGASPAPLPDQHDISVRFDGADLGEVASLLGLSAPDFVERHNAAPLRVLATGFAPGFVYCGLHDSDLVLPRRKALRPSVPVGSVLFAAGQTAIAATEIPTGWHVIGHTDFLNFRPWDEPPTLLRAGDLIRFTVIS